VVVVARRSASLVGEVLVIQVWPVIHVRDTIQTCENAGIARHFGCAGVMLISMDGNDDLTDHVSRRLVGQVLHPNFKIGVNYLRLKPSEALDRAIKYGYDATDQQMFTRGELSTEAKIVIGMRKQPYFPDHKVFAAVAFKGQEVDPFPANSGGLAAHYGLIPTTSGEATGVAPPVGKIERMRRSLNYKEPLAIASGVTPENAGDFVRAGVTHILVATGISRDFHNFSMVALAQLMAQIDIAERTQ
jgi:predicted TIM-barrel enzyme